MCCERRSAKKMSLLISDRLEQAFATLPNHARAIVVSRVADHPLCPEGLRDPNTRCGRHFFVLMMRHNPTEFEGGAPWGPLRDFLNYNPKANQSLVQAIEEVIFFKHVKDIARTITVANVLAARKNIPEDVGSVVFSFLTGIKGSKEKQLAELRLKVQGQVY